HYAMLANSGELDGVRILSPERIAVATDIQSFEWDEVYHVRVRRALGDRRAQDCGPKAGPSAFGHVGGGGSSGHADAERKFAIGFAKNYFTYNTGGGGPPQRRAGLAVAEAVTSALGGW